MTRHFRLLPFFVVPLVVVGCLEGGANDGRHGAGNREGGIQLALGEIAMDGGGRYFISRSDGKVVVGDLVEQSMRVIEELPTPDIVAFWSGAKAGGFFLVAREIIEEGEETRVSQTVYSYDLASERIVWSRVLPRWDLRLDVTRDGRGLVVSGLKTFAVLDAASGETLDELDVEGIADLDLTHDGTRIVVTGVERWGADDRPWTTLTVRSLVSRETVCTVMVPNCDSELVLSADDSRAFLAPTLCQRDPVSVVDLDRCEFEENLPGFGPVALSPRSDIVVAFLDRDNDDPLAPPRPAEVDESPHRYHLMFISVSDLTYETTPIGDHLPRYAFTPDGRALLVDSAWTAEGPVLIIDVDARSARTVGGEVGRLNDFVITPDSAHAFVVDRALFDIDIPAARSKRIPLTFTPTGVNITPAGDRLLLKSDVDSAVYLYDVEHVVVVGRVTMAAGPSSL